MKHPNPTVDRDPGTRKTVPFHIWKHNVQLAAIKLGAPSADVMAQSDQLRKTYNAGEPIWMAAHALAFVIKQAALHLRVEAEKRQHRRMLAGLK